MRFPVSRRIPPDMRKPLQAMTGSDTIAIIVDRRYVKHLSYWATRVRIRRKNSRKRTRHLYRQLSRVIFSGRYPRYVPQEPDKDPIPAAGLRVQH